MAILDIVLLTADKYLDAREPSPLIQNVRIEDDLVANALENEGFRIAIKSWSDPEFDWASTKYVLIRTPWDYFERSQEFMDWFRTTSQKTTFINSAELIQWNFDKNYLKGLQQKGIPIPKTHFITQKTDVNLQEAIQIAEQSFEYSCGTWVLKPCVAAGAFNTYKFEKAEIPKYEKRFKELISDADFMLQEFQESIPTKGEISLVLFGTTFSHAVLKRAKSGDFRVQDDYGGTVELHKATKAEIDFGLKVVNACSELPLYSRVDILEDNQGHLALAELEIFEPELWFRFQPESAYKLAKTIKTTYFS